MPIQPDTNSASQERDATTELPLYQHFRNYLEHYITENYPEDNLRGGFLRLFGTLQEARFGCGRDSTQTWPTYAEELTNQWYEWEPLFIDSWTETLGPPNKLWYRFIKFMFPKEFSVKNNATRTPNLQDTRSLVESVIKSKYQNLFEALEHSSQLPVMVLDPLHYSLIEIGEQLGLERNLLEEIKKIVKSTFESSEQLP